MNRDLQLIQNAREDFSRFLDEVELTDSEVWILTSRTDDRIPMPEDVELIQVKPSLIHGLGLFAVESVYIGQLLAPMNINGLRTPAGRFANHSNEPNCIAVPKDDNLYLVAARNLEQGEELLLNYRQPIAALGERSLLWERTHGSSVPLVQLANKHHINTEGMSNSQKVEVIEWILTHYYEDILPTFPLEHHISDGVYARSLTIPKGVMITGKIHTKGCTTILLKGDITIMSDEGMQRIKAPYIASSAADIKRAGYTHEDSIFITVHATELTEIEAIEEELFRVSDITWVDELLNTLNPPSNQSTLGA
jgi:hypothetical protein